MRSAVKCYLQVPVLYDSIDMVFVYKGGDNHAKNL